MFRYLTLVWNPRSEEACNAVRLLKQRLSRISPDWESIFDHSGLFVSCIPNCRSADRVISLSENSGIVLGTLFTAESPGTQKPGIPLAAIGKHETDTLIRTNGQSIITDNWGSYVLFLRNPSSQCTYVVRGPMGNLPCFHSTSNGINLFYSSIDDMLALNFVRHSINWDVVRAQAARGDYLTRETALQGVTSVLCGDCIEVKLGDPSCRSYWNPGKVTESQIGDFTEAATLVRSRTRQCIESWASLHDKVITLLSGGLDSSIVLSCLAQSKSRDRVTCINFYSRDAGDERIFARSVANRYGVELVEQERNHHVDLRMFLQCARTASPVLHYSACDSEPVCINLARDLGATAVFNGELGDNLFGNVVHHVVLEYFYRHRLTPELLRVALDYALLNRVSIWSVLRACMRDRRLVDNAYSWSPYQWAKAERNGQRGLVSEEALQSYESMASRFLHPWLQDLERVPPGKYTLIWGLLITTSTSYQSPFADDALFVAPLASQPLVEAALQIPTHFNIMRGQDRAVARQAFNSDLPDIVLNRGTGKGTTEPWVRDVIVANRDFVRELLLDGVLVREHILDKARVEEVLSGEVNKSSNYLAEVFEQLYIEAWLRRWSESRAQEAA